MASQVQATDIERRGKKLYKTLISEQIEFALRMTDGNITKASRMLGVYPQQIRRRCRREPELQKVLDESREQVVDEAESQLMKGVKAGDKDMIKIALSSRYAKSRGYGEDKGLQFDFGKKGLVSVRVIDD